MTQEQTTAMLKLRYAASDLSDKALIAFYTEQGFHMDELHRYIERLETALTEYKGAMQNA